MGTFYNFCGMPVKNVYVNNTTRLIYTSKMYGFTGGSRWVATYFRTWLRPGYDLATIGWNKYLSDLCNTVYIIHVYQCSTIYFMFLLNQLKTVFAFFFVICLHALILIKIISIYQYIIYTHIHINIYRSMCAYVYIRMFFYITLKRC